jgi:hypothetical protein
LKRPPKPIEVERCASPDSWRIAWVAQPKASMLTGGVRPEEKERARAAIVDAIRADGYDPARCEIGWNLAAGDWAWTARLKEEVKA